jgi:hypothetical protein
MRKPYRNWLPILLVCLATVTASAQSFRVQCPNTTITHPAASNAEPVYSGPTTYTTDATGQFQVPSTNVNGAIKCQQISGGDGYSTMGDGTQTYMFSFGPLSGLADIAAGKPGTEFPNVFNSVYLDSNATPLQPGDPATTDNGGGNFTFNGAIGLTGDQQLSQPGGATATAQAILAVDGTVGAVNITNQGSGYVAPPTVTFSAPQQSGGLAPDAVAVISGGNVVAITFNDTGSGYTSVPTVTISAPVSGACALPNAPAACLTGHVDPRQIMDVGVLNGNIPAPLMAIDEDDEFFLTLTNVGMIMRPDLFEQHTVHFHGYPNASTFYDGVPDASVAINIGGSFTYYYLAPDAGTYFWHCHITPPEHLQMGMVGQIYVRPRQNRVRFGQDLYAALQQQQTDLRTKCDSTDILCSNPLPKIQTGATGGFVTASVTGRSGHPTKFYAYNDGDGSTQYDVEYPLQIHGFDPNFHFVGMTFNPEGFADMND